ncbi:hypothetical protein PYW08_012553 [Mythimna loreyi]|uniref:Uncharacterized protein n=1 Tax=Mythimna loreyi TaxID=667449 RepID=A0ACC2Q399_9NEOP|nr:hypothetical protein PYW08_012553 [Mythimna loreyi]
MPLNRTPPSTSPTPTSAATLPVEITQAHLSALSSSEPNLSLKTDSLATDITLSHSSRNVKRKLSGVNRDSGLINQDSGLSVFMSEMKQMFNDFKLQQDEKYEKLLSLANSIRDSFDHLTIQHNSLKCQVEQLETERKEHLFHIQELESKLEQMEQSSRSSCIEIRNIPTSNTETKSALLDTVLGAAKLLDVKMQPRDVKDLFRIKTKDPAIKPIIVDFTSVLLKEEFLMKFRKHNKTSFKLTTEHLKLVGPAKPIFISENLSARNKRLFYLARDAAKSNGFQFCWVSHGKIFVREKIGKTHYLIKNEADLARVIKTA